MSISFLGFEQKRLDLADRERLAPFLAAHAHELSGYTFAALYAWQDAFDYAWCFADDGLVLVSCVLAPGGERHLLQPIGRLRPEVAAKLVENARGLGYALEVVGVGERFLLENRGFAERFEIVPDRGMANYIYGARDLAELRGARFAKKRNLIAQAENGYSWSVERLRPEHAAVCRTLLHAIEEREQEGRSVDSERLAAADAAVSSAGPTSCSAPALLASMPMRGAEVAALERTLDQLGTLEQQGVLVRVDGEPAAFSIFEAQSDDTAVVHFERALRSRKGLYQVVNRETARAVADLGYSWLNREEDLGDPGLRQAKSSYHPARLADAWRLVGRCE